MYKAALFDLDGVVFDTEPQYTVFWGSQCRHYHPEEPDLEYRIKGQTLDQIYERWFAGDLAAERPVITRRLNEFESQMNFDYVTGFEQFIATLRSRDIKTAVVTSSNRRKMEAVYRKHPEFKVSRQPRASVSPRQTASSSKTVSTVCVPVVPPK